MQNHSSRRRNWGESSPIRRRMIRNLRKLMTAFARAAIDRQQNSWWPALCAARCQHHTQVVSRALGAENGVCLRRFRSDYALTGIWQRGVKLTYYAQVAKCMKYPVFSFKLTQHQSGVRLDSAECF